MKLIDTNNVIELAADSTEQDLCERQQFFKLLHRWCIFLEFEQGTF